MKIINIPQTYQFELVGLAIVQQTEFFRRVLNEESEQRGDTKQKENIYHIEGMEALNHRSPPGPIQNEAFFRFAFSQTQWPRRITNIIKMGNGTRK